MLYLWRGKESSFYWYLHFPWLGSFDSAKQTKRQANTEMKHLSLISLGGLAASLLGAAFYHQPIASGGEQPPVRLSFCPDKQKKKQTNKPLNQQQASQAYKCKRRSMLPRQPIKPAFTLTTTSQVLMMVERNQVKRHNLLWKATSCPSWQAKPVSHRSNLFPEKPLQINATGKNRGCGFGAQNSSRLFSSSSLSSHSPWTLQEVRFCSKILITE